MRDSATDIVLRDTKLRAAGRRLALLALVAATALLAATGAAARPTATIETATVPADAGLPWTDPNHQTPLEVLASNIATHIAGRPVTVRCQGDTDWRTVAGQHGVNPDIGLAFVAVNLAGGGGATPDNVAQLSPAICLALQKFAQATTKPTTCAPPITTVTTVTTTVPAPAPAATATGRTGTRRTTAHDLDRNTKKTVKVTRTTTTTTPGPIVPCYDNAASVGSARFAMPVDNPFLATYQTTAQAISTLAHEAIHLGGTVGGTLSNGAPFGIVDAEARAECFGLQWMEWTAEQLGASPADALAIAQLQARWIYPAQRNANPLYWSPSCVAGGALDIRTDTTAPWPAGLR